MPAPKTVFTYVLVNLNSPIGGRTDSLQTGEKMVEQMKRAWRYRTGNEIQFGASEVQFELYAKTHLASVAYVNSKTERNMPIFVLITNDTLCLFSALVWEW